MIKVEKVEVYGFEAAIRGMRNPLNSWTKSDSTFTSGHIELGPGDLALARKLAKAGSEHRKFLRMIHVSMDVTSNQVWWQEFDTYKVGTARNSCSKMHTIHIKEFESSDFSHEGIDECGDPTVSTFVTVILELERLRMLFNKTHEKRYWRAIIELLPTGYNIRATIDMNYENALNIINQRSAHKMFEWNYMCHVLKALPYFKEITEA